MNRFLEVSLFSQEDWKPSDTSEVISWQGHIPFAFSLIRIAKPSYVVELGTHKGDSYLAFCQAVKRYSLPTKCFAIDTWKGDEQAGYYGEEVFDQLRIKNNEKYGNFSELIRLKFDDAVAKFENGSIDLLHIDGLHTYEAVRNDFEAWKSKLSAHGIVLFHDTAVRQADFGVWRLWQELSAEYASFEFSHSNGLGVLAVGKDAARLLPDLFNAASETVEKIRQLYSTLGNSVAFDGLYKLLLMERQKATLNLAAVNLELMERDSQLAEVRQQIGERDILLEEVNDELAEKNNQLFAINPALIQCNDQLASVKRELSKINNLFNDSKQQAAERDIKLTELSQQVAERDSQLTELSQQVAERDSQLTELSQQVAERDSQLSAILNSNTWKFTAPLRRVVNITRFAVVHPKSFTIALLRKIYHHIPVSTFARNRFKGWLYSIFPVFFSQTLSYQLWKSQSPGATLTISDMEKPLGLGEPFNLHCPENPIVSIVIPVYGQIEYTYNCLRSLRSHRSNYSFEVIVVDDCSPDNTLDVLDIIKGLRIVCNETNRGFIRSCNRGAQEASGKLLVMLNNDTVVSPGWLDELVNTFNCIPQAGLVGSKLIYPDGRLQEAGGIIWQDGSGWNYGRLQDPNRPEFNYLRDVDYCSGASLMITKELFDQLGGFDELYAPAYGEDSDLAFRVRQSGYRVLYQPMSQLVHFEGVTSGKEVSKGVKACQVENAKKLYDRWKVVIEGHGEPGWMLERAKDRKITGHALVLDHCTPTPDQDAGSITALNIMRIMQGLGFKVTFVPEDNFLYLDPYTKDLQRIGIECLYAPYVTSVEQHLAEFGRQYDVVVVFRLLAAERNLSAIRKYCPNAKIVFHTSDLHHLREKRAAEIGVSESLRQDAEVMKERELRIIRTVDATIVHSSAEKDLLEIELCSREADRRVFLFGWAIEVPGTQQPFDKRDGIVFIGGYQHQPNVDAVLYFVKKVFPLVKRRLPDALFRIVGSRAPAEVLVLAGDGIEVVGFVEDLRTVLDRCRLSVVPIRYGAGIKGKIGTSLSYGLPCVSTPLGTEGMGLTAKDGVLEADDPEAFAEAVVRLHQDAVLWESCSRGGLDFVRRNYSFEAGIQTIGNLLQSIGVSKQKIVQRESPLLAGDADLGRFEADQAEDPLEMICDIDSQTEYEKWYTSDFLKGCRDCEDAISRTHSNKEVYCLPGFCRVCGREVDFLVDRQCGAWEDCGIWRPNWRERLVCPICGLNNRQRMIAMVSRNILKSFRDRRPEVYLMEQTTPIYKWMKTSLPQANFTGSEYLGNYASPGKVIKGIRHEDAERLSFNDGGFDLIISNDVLEHVVNPGKALSEAYRVLKPQGKLLLTVPFHLRKEKSERRAIVVEGMLKHILPPVYHGNPVSEKGSLVFTDFGWDFLKDIKAAGFETPTLRFYWSEVYGHLGPDQHYIYALRR